MSDDRDRQGWWPEEPPPAGAGRSEPGESDGDDGGGEQPRRPPRGLESRDRPRVASRYSRFVGIAFVVLVAVAIFNAVRTEEGGILGAEGEASRGTPIREFALPDVLAGPDADANLAQDDCETAANPCPPDAVREPACEIDVPGAIRICDLFDRPLAISFWFTRGGDCLPTQDAFDRVAAARGDEANFLSINVLDDREKVAALIRQRGWQVPVGHDADGAVSNVFGVGVCPTLVLAYPGGVIDSAEIKPGNFSEEEIDALVDQLLEASARREPLDER